MADRGTDLFGRMHTLFSPGLGLFATGMLQQAASRHKVFISFCHKDQRYKDALVTLGQVHDIFVDKSVDIGDISENQSDEQIRVEIRDDYLRDSTVTIVLVGADTKRRKHVDWEIHSSMYDGKTNKRSGILAVNLPTLPRRERGGVRASHDGEKVAVYPDIKDWTSLDSREKLAAKYPHMPDRLLDNLNNNKAKISVTTWDYIQEPRRLRFLIDAAFNDRNSCKYDLRRPMMRRNS